MRKMAALAVVQLGLTVLALAIVVLVWHGLSLPALSAQTEGQWAAYRLHGWALLLGELLLGLGIFLAGYLLRPGRLAADSLVRPLAIVGMLLALAASGAAGFVVYSTVQYGEPFLQVPWLAVQGGTLLGGLVVLAALAVRKATGRLPAGGVEPSGAMGARNSAEM